MLDVSLLSSISDFVKEIETEFDKIDILINNAGIMFHPFQRTIEGNELTAATNYLGNCFRILTETINCDKCFRAICFNTSATTTLEQIG